MEKDFKGFNHGKGKINITHPVMGLMKPIEVHLKEDGTKTNGPSLAIVMKDLTAEVVVGEISVEMLNEGLSDIGYQIIKK